MKNLERRWLASDPIAYREGGMTERIEQFRISIEWVMESDGSPCSLSEAEAALQRAKELFASGPPYNMRVTGFKIQAEPKP